VLLILLSRRAAGSDVTPKSDDEIEPVIKVLEGEMDKLRTKVSHPEVVEALRKVHHETKKGAL